MVNNKKLHYSWVIVISCFIITMFIQLQTNTWSYFQLPVTTELGISYVQFSISSMLATVANMVFGIVLASRIAKGNLRMYMLGGGIIAAVLWFLQGYATQIWQIYLTYSLLSFALAAVLYIPINILMTNWFIDKKAMALSLAILGSSIGQMIFSPVIAGFIETNGWRPLSRVYGIVTLVAIFVVFLLVRKSPADKGLEPYRSNKNSSDQAAAAQKQMWMGLTKKEAVKTGTFWLFAFVVVCVGIIAAGIITQIPTFLGENQISYAVPMVVYSLCVILGKVTIGPLFDKLGVFGGIVICMVMIICSLVAMFFVSASIVWAYVSMALFGLGCIAGALVPPLMVSNLFGVKEYGGIYGFANFFFYGGCMIGSILTAGIRTATGSYNAAWIVCTAICAVIIVFSGICIKLSKKLKEAY